MWSRADVIGLFSNNVVSFSSNVVLSGPSFSLNSVSKPRMFLVRTVYVLSSLYICLRFGIRRHPLSSAERLPESTDTRSLHILVMITVRGSGGKHRDA